ncbi:MAG: D-tyrosyl-tRNA(Tyr) deacylase [Treponema sp.]|nr:D-tyrosyl-tRNA(Tyr) deacylase [Treponema sp.]
MKAVVQRVRGASVLSGGRTAGSIAAGLLVYLGVAREDVPKDACRLAEKIVNLRIFDDEEGRMNLSLKDVIRGGGGAGVLAVSQFTLLADTSRGRRPFYGDAAGSEDAKILYEYFVEKIREEGVVCETGIFQARMDVTCTNDGPVTILIDS